MAENKARLREEKDIEKLLNKAGTEHLKRGKVRAAAVYFQEAIDIDPDYLLALNNLAWILATHRGADLRDGAKAVDFARRAVRVANKHRKPDAMGTLAAAYAEAGRFEEAVATAEQAIERAREIGAKGIERGLLQEIALYRDRQPVRME
jgi:tetratricopeptide (TPR) repeat protein